MLYDSKTNKFNIKGLSASFEETTGKKLSANLGEIDFSSVPPDVSERLRSQAELHFQVCKTIHALPSDSPKRALLLEKFAEHLMDIEAALVSVFEIQQKKSSDPNIS